MISATSPLYREFVKVPCQTHDLFSKLPDELIELCFDDLKKKDLFKLNKVCKKWYIKSSLSTSWKKHIIKRFDKTHFVLEKQYFNKYCYINLEMNHVFQTRNFASDFHATLGNSINDVTENYNFIQIEHLNELNYTKKVGEIAKKYPLNRVINLQSYERNLTDEVLHAFSSYNTHLEAVSFSESFNETGGNFVELTLEGIHNFATSVPFLSHLVIDLARLPRDATEWVGSISVFATNCSLLKSIEVHNHLMSNEDLISLSQKCPKLKSIYIEGTINVTKVGLTAIENMSCLRQFNLINVNCELLEELIKSAPKWPKLESITITCDDLINSEIIIGVLNLSKTCAKLKKMVLSQHFDLHPIPIIREQISQVKSRLDLEFLVE